MCHKLGHFENRCPEKVVEIHHINVGPVYTADAKVDKGDPRQWSKEINVSIQTHRFPQVPGVEAPETAVSASSAVCCLC